MRSVLRLLAPALAAALLALASVAGVSAHGMAHAGPFTFAIGFQHEPTFVGQVNGVQVFVSDDTEKPVTDIAAGDLSVVVGFGDQLSQKLSLEPAFDVEEGWGTPGEYDAVFVPTSPGDYTFHITGAIHSAPVDLQMTSSPSTFSSAETTAALEFPVKVPAIGDLATKVDRLDTRLQGAQAGLGQVQAAVQQAQSSNSTVQASLQAAQAAANQARDDASRALMVGFGAGVLGILIGLLALVSSLRGRQRSVSVGERSPMTS